MVKYLYVVEVHYFNPRSLAGATNFKQVSSSKRDISIHAPSRERPACTSAALVNREKFQSTLPRGSDLFFCVSYIIKTLISIHAPSRERPVSTRFRRPIALFQSTLPRGSDRRIVTSGICITAFQSTLPRGSDLCISKYKCWIVRISIHAPSRERPT